MEKDLTKVRVMKMANILHKSNTLKEALELAWSLYHIRLIMEHGVLAFAYRKKDGSEREAVGTLCPIIIPQCDHPKGTDRPQEPNYSVFNYYDIDAKGWRSFDIQNWLGMYDAYVFHDARQIIADAAKAELKKMQKEKQKKNQKD